MILINILEHELPWRLWLYLIIFLQLVSVCSTYKDKYCGTIDIRGIGAFGDIRKNYTNCTVVEGNFIITLHDDSSSISQYVYSTLESIRVITGYLVVFHNAESSGIVSLSRVLPNLRVIVGDELIANYAIVVFGNDPLRDIGLVKLSAVLNGGIIAYSNRKLCYVRTINWERITGKSDKHMFIDEGVNLHFAQCIYGATCNSNGSKRCLFDDGRPMCWNKDTCQKICDHDFEESDVMFDQDKRTETGEDEITERIRGPGCNDFGRRCHEECLGGCLLLNDSSSCHYCKNVNSNGTCMPKCPEDTVELRLLHKIRRCISVEECRNISNEITAGEAEAETLRITNGICQVGCPFGMEKDEKNAHGCKNCTDPGGCRNRCHDDFLLDDSSGLQRLFRSRCEVIEGNLVIELSENSPRDLFAPMKKALSRIKEIKGYLVIRFSLSLTSLRFFKNLERIGGEDLYQDRFALAVFENKNLAELFGTREGKTLVIGNGTVMFHNNPQLCYEKITQLLNETRVNISFEHASKHSNGYQTVCDHQSLTVWTKNITNDTVIIEWVPMTMKDTDYRLVLGYQIFYIALAPNVSKIDKYEQRSVCNDKWKMKYFESLVNDSSLEDKPVENLSAILTGLRPYQRYAFYLQAKVILDANVKQGVSDVKIFRTLAYKPSEPSAFQHKAEASQISLSWGRPKSPNGNVTHYMVEIEAQEDAYFNKNTAVCDSFGRRIASVKSPPTQQKEYHRFDIQDACRKYYRDYCELSREDDGATVSKEFMTEKYVRHVNNVENTIQDHIFQLHPERTNYTRTRSKRDYKNDTTPHFLKSFAYGNCTEGTDYYGATANCSLVGHIPIQRFNVSSLRAVIRGLKHYTNYRVQVSACQKGDQYNVGYCSGIPAEKICRTTELLQNDVVAEIQIVPLNASIEGNERTRAISWREVADPNGIVFGYEVRLIPIGIEKADPVSKCINATDFRRKRSVVFNRLAEGTYEVDVQPITTAVVNGSITNNTSTMNGHLVVKESLLTWRLALKLLLAVVLVIVVGGILFSTMQNNATRKLALGKEALFSVGFVEDEEDEYIPDEWDIDRTKIEFIRKIGAGRFGEVFYAKPLPESGLEFTECAVKMSPLTDDALSRKHFIAEGQLMKNFNTQFIIKLYGISAEKEQPALIFLEYMEKGNLRDLLRERRDRQEQEYLELCQKYKRHLKRLEDSKDGKRGSNGSLVDISPPRKPFSVGYDNSIIKLDQCFLWGAQMADAMAYLEAHQFVHRDLAARNVLVDMRENVKLGDFGLTRDVYYHEYYRPSGARPLPVRWMSPETMRDGIFTSKSDVWSYGIVLYEIFTLGERPYPHVDNDLVFEYVEKRNVNKKPLGCQTFWYNLMLNCWRYQPNSRPSFAQIVSKLLPFVEDPKFIEQSFTCNTAKNAEDTGRIEFVDKDVASERRQEEYVKLKVKEQQRTVPVLEIKESIGGNKGKDLEQLELDRDVKLVNNGPDKEGFQELVTKDKSRQSLVSKGSKLGMLIEKAVLEVKEKAGFNGHVKTADSEIEVKTGYVARIPSWKNGPVCITNRRLNRSMKKDDVNLEATALHNGFKDVSVEDGHFSFKGLVQYGECKGYSAVVEEDSV